MRVVQLGPYPPPHGGVQTNLVAIRDLLRGTGHECDAINLTRFRRENADGVYYPTSARELAGLLWRLPADILHLHFGGDLTPRLLGLLCLCTLLPGRKTVLSFHSGGYPGSPAGRTAAPSTLRGYVFRRLDGVIAVNPEIAAMFRKFGVCEERIRTILPFVVRPPDPAVPMPRVLADFFAAHQPVLLTVGLLEPEYDLPMQIDVMGEIIARFPRAGLVIAGAGSLEEGLRRQIDGKPYADHVLLYGDMPHPVTLRATLECDALLRTTRYDGDSVSVREALYLGTPVIATDNGLRPAGVVLVPPSDPVRLRDAVCELLSRGCGRQAPAGDGQENVRLVVDFYRELLATKGEAGYRRA
ncbi:MAG TPA: glycosyltransferase family 4 protein [Candidatus Acidoferrales bacterium]|nr:glycosyltransferase family 4 protein [Candidatus Acidoferrales bacterium]